MPAASGWGAEGAGPRPNVKLCLSRSSPGLRHPRRNPKPKTQRKKKVKQQGLSYLPARIRPRRGVREAGIGRLGAFFFGVLAVARGGRHLLGLPSNNRTGFGVRGGCMMGTLRLRAGVGMLGTRRHLAGVPGSSAGASPAGPKRFGSSGDVQGRPLPCSHPWGRGWGHHAPSVPVAGAWPWSQRSLWHRRGSGPCPEILQPAAAPAAQQQPPRLRTAPGTPQEVPKPLGTTAGRGGEGEGAVPQLPFPPAPT